MFGIKPRDNLKEMREFETLRQAWKPAERRGPNANGADGASQDGAGTNQEAAPMSNITVTVAPARTAPTDASIDDRSSIVSIGSAWQGNLKIEGSVRIDGELSGEVEAGGTVIVSEGARVDARVRANFVVIAGQFQGRVECSDRLEILPTGRVIAELSTNSLVIHEGAFLEGQVHMSERMPVVSPNGSVQTAEPIPTSAAATEPPSDSGSPA